MVEREARRLAEEAEGQGIEATVEQRFVLMLHDRIVSLEAECAGLGASLRAAEERLRRLELPPYDADYGRLTGPGEGSLDWSVREPVEAARVATAAAGPVPLTPDQWDAPVHFPSTGCLPLEFVDVRAPFVHRTVRLRRGCTVRGMLEVLHALYAEEVDEEAGDLDGYDPRCPLVARAREALAAGQRVVRADLLGGRVWYEGLRVCEAPGMAKWIELRLEHYP